MSFINKNFLELNEQYLFSEIGNIVNKKKEKEPNLEIINMSIGDIKLPLEENIIEELHKASTEMGKIECFKGYSPEQGHGFLRKSIKESYENIGVELELEDVFVNDGAKSDLGNILEIFSNENIVGLQSVTYPVYYDACKIAGFSTVFIKSDVYNNFLPMPKDVGEIKPNIIYLCSPNNPTGVAYNKSQLSEWVKYSLNNNIVIILDSAYKSFISSLDVPQSIYEIEGAKKCVIEICSFSKSFGFTGVRCGYTILPKEIICTVNGKKIHLQNLWRRRQATKFNGVCYLSQRAAFKALEQKQSRYILYYKNNARILKKTLDSLNFKFWGGVDSPYIWLQCPNKTSSKEYFYFLLNNFGLVTTPGVGFGKNGEGFIRISLLNTVENVTKCAEVFLNYYKNFI